MNNILRLHLHKYIFIKLKIKNQQFNRIPPIIFRSNKQNFV